MAQAAQQHVQVNTPSSSIFEGQNQLGHVVQLDAEVNRDVVGGGDVVGSCK
jgi:hypothetical protein